MMEYALPKDLAYQFNLSQKTVYNYLSKYPDKIRTKKEFWKKFIHSEDFTKVVQQVYNINSKSFPNMPIENKIEVWSDSKSEAVDIEYVISKNTALEKNNANLTDQLTKYAILLKEEKTEKNLFLDKYEKLQQVHNNKIEEFGEERIKQKSKYSILLVITWVMSVVAIMIICLYLLGVKVGIK